MRTEGYSFLAALALHVVVVLVARAMPPLSLLGPSDQRQLRTIEIDLPASVPVVEIPKPLPLPEPAPPLEPTERTPDARVAARTVLPDRNPRPPTTAEPEAPPPTSTPAPAPQYDRMPEDNGGRVLTAPDGLGLNEPVWATGPILPPGSGEPPPPAPTVSPEARKPPPDIATRIIVTEMQKNDKGLGLDPPVAGSMASAVRTSVMGSAIPAGTKGSIVCNVSAAGVVSGCRVAASTGGGAEAWSAATQAASAIAGNTLPETYARGAVVTIDISVSDTPPAGSKGGWQGAGAAFDTANIGAHATRKVVVTHKVAAR